MTFLKKVKNDCPVVLFLCSPSLGMLDSCLSVLKALRDKLPNAHFIFLASKEGVIDQICLESEVIKISDKIFDKVIFRTATGVLLNANTFDEAIKLNANIIIKVSNNFEKILNKLKLKFLNKLVRLIFNVLINIVVPKNIFKVIFFKNIRYITIFDARVLYRDYNKDLYNVVSCSPNFSILHGTGIVGVQTIVDNKIVHKEKMFFKNNILKKTTAYLFSEKEISYFKEFYNLGSEQIKVYGIPKHEKQWIKNLETDCDETNNKCIFIISRPTSTTLPISRRIKFLKMIHKIAAEYNLEVIVKLHPKELDSNLYKKVFDSRNKKIEWKISNKHPYSLAKKCEFAISYYSGVSIDLIPLGVPTIELSDFRGISQDDHELSMRNSRGEAVREYRYLGLVLGATLEDEFEQHVKEILSNKNKVVRNLQRNYNKLFPTNQNINNIIAEEIKKSIVDSVNQK
jgi:hypothetical protein